MAGSEWRDGGLAAVPARPAIYVSSESHLAWVKIARMAGLGSDAVRLVPPADGLALHGKALREFIADDAELDPALIVATAGTTAHGSVDHMESIAAVAREHDAHFHVDAAWAGAVVLCEQTRGILAGIQAADSVTLDAHKWLSVPMGAGMYLARDWSPLQAAFDVSTAYMPSASHEHRDPYIHSGQWSRRFTGLKLFMALAALGRSGYAALIRQMIETGDYLRETLLTHGWQLHNDTPLPLVCFAPSATEGGRHRCRYEWFGVDDETAADHAGTRVRARAGQTGLHWFWKFEHEFRMSMANGQLAEFTRRHATR